MTADAGIVKIHAQTMLPATPQRTALTRCAEPTPTIAPVMVCVVETGMPKRGRQEQRDRAAGLGAEAADRLQLGDLLAHGLDDAPAAEQRAERRSRRSSTITTQIGSVDRAVGDAGGDQQQPDDAHRLLRVVAAVAEAVERRRDELQPAEPAVDASRRRAPKTDPRHAIIMISAPSRKPSSGETKMNDAVLQDARRDQRRDAGLGDRRADMPPISACEELDGMP